MKCLGRRNVILVLLPVLVLGTVGTGCRNTLAPALQYSDFQGYQPQVPSGASGPSTFYPTMAKATPAPVQFPAAGAPVPSKGGMALVKYQPGMPQDPVVPAVPLTEPIPQPGPPPAKKPSAKQPPLQQPAGDQPMILPPGQMPPHGHGHLPDGPLPTELNLVSHPPYTVAPPDILIFDGQPLVPKVYQIQPFDVLEILVFQNLPKLPGQETDKKREPLIAGDFRVTPEGKILLPVLGAPTPIHVGGLTLEQAHEAIHERLSKALKNVDVYVNLKQFRTPVPIIGEHLVRPDGTINLGTYGYVYVAGMTLGQIKMVVEQHLSQYVLNPQISVDVRSYNSKKYYLIIDGGGYGQLVFAYPYTGYETVLDAVSKLNGLPWWASKKKIWVARPAPAGHPCSQVLPVDWNSITQGGTTDTNWQLMPGDRIFVRADCLIETDNWIAKVLNPINRVLNSTLLGTSVYNSITNRNNGNVGFVAAIP